MLTKMAPLLSNMRRDDENTVLLKALRPYLHGDREKRLDDAIKIMQFIRVMPAAAGPRVVLTPRRGR